MSSGSGSSSAKTFLSNTNKEHVLALCNQYLKNAHSIEVPLDRLFLILKSVMQDLKAYYDENPPFPSLEDMNKRTIVKTKERIMLFMREAAVAGRKAPTDGRGDAREPQKMMVRKAKSSNENVATNSLPPPPSIPRPVPASNDALVPGALFPIAEETVEAVETAETEEVFAVDAVIGMEEDTNTRGNDKDIFMRRLQELELQRNASLASKMEQSATTAPSQPVFLQSTQPAASSLTAGPTVLYVPTVQSQKATNTLQICGLDREWYYFHDRSVLVWSDSTVQQNASRMYLSCVLLPSFVRNRTPLVQVCIESVGNHQQLLHCVCRDSGGGSGSGGWDIWKPPTESAGALLPLACPWTIHIRDVMGQPLAIGHDGITITEAQRLTNGHTKWTLQRHPEDSVGSLLGSGITKGHHIICRQADGTQTKHEILQVYENEVSVLGDQLQCKGCICAVWELQATILIETEKLTTTVEKK